MARVPRRATGFTMIELMVVVALTGIILALAAPSFTDFLAKKRVEGIASELDTDVQFARSESVRRNTAVRISFGSANHCYVIHTVGSTASSCNTTGASTIGTGATELKTVQLPGSGPISLSREDELNYIEFDPVRAMASSDAGDSPYWVDVVGSNGGWTLRPEVSKVGRVRICNRSSNGKPTNYKACS